MQAIVSTVSVSEVKPKSNLLAIALAARAEKMAKDGPESSSKTKEQEQDQQKQLKQRTIVDEAVNYIESKALEVAAIAAARGHGYTRVPTPGSSDKYVFYLPGTHKETVDGKEFLVQNNPEAAVYFSGKDGNPCEGGLPWIGILQGFRPKGQEKGDPIPSSVPGGRTVTDRVNERLSHEGVRIDVAFSGKDRGLVLTAIWEEDAWEKRQQSIARKHSESRGPRRDERRDEDRRGPRRDERRDEARPRRSEGPRLADFIA